MVLNHSKSIFTLQYISQSEVTVMHDNSINFTKAFLALPDHQNQRYSFTGNLQFKDDYTSSRMTTTLGHAPMNFKKNLLIIHLPRVLSFQDLTPLSVLINHSTICKKSMIRTHVHATKRILVLQHARQTPQVSHVPASPLAFLSCSVLLLDFNAISVYLNTLSSFTDFLADSY